MYKLLAGKFIVPTSKEYASTIAEIQILWSRFQNA